MLLRRITEHIDNQNWLAVAVDFCIVVLGVFIGLQVSNWSENQKTEQAYLYAQQRLLAESEANLAAVRNFISTNETNLNNVRNAIQVLQKCTHTPQGMNKLLLGLNKIRSTQTLRLRLNALETITHNDDLLSRQKQTERERLNELYRSLLQAQDTLDWLETMPFQSPVEHNPAVGVGDLISRIGPTQEFFERQLTLTQPIDELCREGLLIKHFYVWERTTIFQTVRASQVELWLSQHIGTMETNN